MFIITRKYLFSAAHRLEGHPKCSRCHGHNYVVTVTLNAEALEDGMVLDYSKMDAVIKPIIDRYDHRYLVSRENRNLSDPYAEIALRNGDAVDLPVDRSTAECIAFLLYELIEASVKSVSSIQVDETEKSSALYVHEVHSAQTMFKV